MLLSSPAENIFVQPSFYATHSLRLRFSTVFLLTLCTLQIYLLTL